MVRPFLTEFQVGDEIMFGSLFGLGRSAPAPTAVDRLADYVPDIVHVGKAAEADHADVEALAATLGIEVQRYACRKDISGTLQLYGRQWVIGLNASDGLNRQRFTLAHEIGHYVMHRDLVVKRKGLPGVADDHGYRQPTICGDTNPFVTIDHERQATMIAIRILMGTDKMRRLIAEGLSVFQIADRIGCSAKAVAIRIQTLKAPLGGR